jgi:hypothetical protein
MFDEDESDNILDAVTRYQASPFGDLEYLWQQQGMYDLSALLPSERVFLERAAPEEHELLFLNPLMRTS